MRTNLTQKTNNKDYEDLFLEFSIKRSDELADASSENVDAVRNLGNKTALGSKGTNSEAHQFSSANSSHVYGNEFDTSVTMLNITVIWFHLHEYAKAYSILDSLYQKIEPIDENFIRKHQDNAKNTNKPPTKGLNKTN
ncbi:hypothetical protein HYC85_015315 [Camellia sinensis]|uniref:Uncharacterized protein n=1 Tax=Camellia sinensis TaxID=4442 RepID=A0A7J7GXB8_CAMSI|nr:hypothetical protein HYC85_015315 [Camellia sinensis]